MYAVRFLVAALFLLPVAGCKSTGQQRSAARVQTMKEIRAGLETTTKQIDTTLASLDQVTANASGDARPAFQQFKKDLAKLDSDVSDVRSLGSSLRAKTAEFFAAWETESQEGIKNPEILKISDERRAKAKEQFETLRKQADATGEAYKTFSDNIHEVEKALEIDLNSAGIAALKPAITRTKAEGKKAQGSVKDLNEELDKIAKALYPAGTEPVPAPASASTP